MSKKNSEYSRTWEDRLSDEKKIQVIIVMTIKPDTDCKKICLKFNVLVLERFAWTDPSNWITKKKKNKQILYINLIHKCDIKLM